MIYRQQEAANEFRMAGYAAGWVGRSGWFFGFVLPLFNLLDTYARAQCPLTTLNIGHRYHNLSPLLPSFHRPRSLDRAFVHLTARK